MCLLFPSRRFRRNEVFIDVLEQLNLLMSVSGELVTADVVGHVMVKTHLSGNPECIFGINEKVYLFFYIPT